MKYGLIAIVRTPLKTITFLLLIAVVTAFFSLGTGMWQSAERMLEEADNTFTTAGEFVFTGGGYPDAIAYDEELAAAAAAFRLDAVGGDDVLFMEESITQRAYLAGYKQGMPLDDYAALLLSVQSYEERFDAYGAVVEGELFSRDSLTGKYVYVYNTEFYQFEPGRQYAVFGRVSLIPNQNFLSVEAVPVEHPMFATLFDGTAPVVDITDYKPIQTFSDSADGVPFRRLGETLTVLNQSIDVVRTDNIAVVYGFHSGEYRLTDGAYFSASDGNVCVVPHRVAAQFGVEVGDSITLSFHRPAGRTGRYSGYRAETGFAAENLVYTIVGIYQTDGRSPPIFLPNGGQPGLAHSAGDYILARASIDNRRADRYTERIRAVLPPGVEFKVYDQGYKAAVLSMNSLRETAVLITALCLVLCVLVLWFFGFLFIGRSERSALALLALGAGKRRVVTYFLSGGGAIAGIAAVLGGLAGYVIAGNMLGAVYASIEAGSIYDFRYSIIGYGVSNETFAATPGTSPLVYLLVAVGVTLAALLCCFFFAVRVVRRQDPRHRFKVQRSAERKRKPAVPKRAIGTQFALSLPTVPLRYGVKSLLRGGKRSLTVPVLFIAMLLFICLFHNMQSGFQARLSTVYDDVPVTLRFSDISGKKIDDLVVLSTQTDSVKETGFTAEEWASYNMRFKFNGIVERADGTAPETKPPVFEMPASAFQRETIINQWQLTADTNVMFVLEGGSAAFEYAPEFAYTDVPNITWADGLSVDRFFRNDGDRSYHIVSEKFLEKHGVALGDTISTVTITDADDFMNGYNWSYYQSEATIAGTYPGTDGRATAYSYRPGNAPGMYQWTPQGGSEFLYSIYHAAGFRLKETHRLSALKDSLETFIDPLGKGGRNRVWAVIDDAALYGTVDSLNRYISFMNLLYPVILGMVIGIGFLVSHLLLKGRAGEIAILRGLGASKRTVFFSFFTEQFLLSLLGGAAGIAAAALALGGVGAVSPIHVALLTICYYAGLTLAIMHTYRSAAVEALAAKEE